MNPLIYVRAGGDAMSAILPQVEKKMGGDWALVLECPDRETFLMANRHNSTARNFDITLENYDLKKWKKNYDIITIERLEDVEALAQYIPPPPASPAAMAIQPRHPAPALNQYYPHRVTAGLPVVLFGGVGNHNSLNVVVAKIAQALDEMGVNVRIRHHETSPVEDRTAWLMSRHFIHEEPKQPYAAISVDRLDPKLDQSAVAFRGVIDSNDSFLTYWPHMLARWNGFDTVFTYSRHSQRVMQETGCKNVTLMPLGVDTRVFRPLEVPRHFPVPAAARVLFQNFKERHTGNRFVFLIAGMMQARKGLADAIEAYRDAFAGRTDVVLWVHGRIKYWGWNQTKLMRELDPPMLWTDGAVSDEELCQMINRAGCYVSSHRLEGFGLMPLQAMACGVPSILTDYAGPKDYATSETSWLIACREVEADAPGIPSGVMWAEPDQAALIKAMLQAADDKGVCARKSAAGQATAAKWGWNRAAEAIVTRIEAAGHLVSRRLSPTWDGRVDILIPVRNAAVDVERMLNSLCAVDPGTDFAVTICDDGSGDNTWEVLSDWAKRKLPFKLKLLRNEFQAGCPATRNKLFSAGESEFCFVADCDLEFKQPGWLASLMASHIREEAGFTAPMLIYPDGRIQSAGGQRDLHGQPCQHRFHGHPASLPAANEPLEVLYAPAAALFIRRSLIERIGGMWEDYRPTFWDDVDWQMLARLHGFKTYYHPEVNIIHHDGSYKRQAQPMEVMNAFLGNQAKFKAMWEGVV